MLAVLNHLRQYVAFHIHKRDFVVVLVVVILV